MNPRQQALTGPERWQVSYADLLTLLLGFFIVMYAVASMEKDQQQAVIQALQESFDGQTKVASASDVLFGASQLWMDQAVNAQTIAALTQANIQVDGDDKWLYLQMASEALFASGSAQLLPQAQKELDTLAVWVRTTTGKIEVEGYTDDQPINSPVYPDNWSLSSARAVAVVSYLSHQKGVDGKRFKAIGFGEFTPVADNATAEGRQQNRRVVVKVETPPAPLVPVVQPLILAPVPQSQVGVKNAKPSANNSNNANNLPVEPSAQILKTRLKDKGLAPKRLPSGALKFSANPKQG